MTLQEFYNYLKTQPIEDKIVCIRYKYSWEDEWNYSNEILEVDIDFDSLYAWAYDWYEGQEDVEVLGCIDVSDVCTTPFNYGGIRK